MKTKLILVIIAFASCIYMSYLLAILNHHVDFPAYYRVAKIVLDPSMPITAIYELGDPTNRYNIPDWFMVYRYSTPVAYLMAPLGLMPYYVSKTIFIFINIILSVVSLSIAMKLGGSKGRWLIYPLALMSLFFLPFFQCYAVSCQTDGIILFIITIAIIMAIKQRFYLCGALIGIAALFKFFPVAIAMALGIKNWRILVGCAATAVSSALFPGFREWIASFAVLPFNQLFYSYPYRHLGVKWFVVYFITINLALAYYVYRNKHLKYEQLAAFSIPAMLLAVPVHEPYHFLLMFFSFGYLLPEIRSSGKISMLSFIISIIFINIGSIYMNDYLFLGLLFALVSIVMACNQTESGQINFSLKQTNP